MKCMQFNCWAKRKSEPVCQDALWSTADTAGSSLVDAVKTPQTADSRERTVISRDKGGVIRGVALMLGRASWTFDIGGNRSRLQVRNVPISTVRRRVRHHQTLCAQCTPRGRCVCYSTANPCSVANRHSPLPFGDSCERPSVGASQS